MYIRKKKRKKKPAAGSANAPAIHVLEVFPDFPCPKEARAPLNETDVAAATARPSTNGKRTIGKFYIV